VFIRPVLYIQDRKSVLLARDVTAHCACALRADCTDVTRHAVLITLQQCSVLARRALEFSVEQTLATQIDTAAVGDNVRALTVCIVLPLNTRRWRRPRLTMT